LEREQKERFGMIPVVKEKLLEAKKGLIVGIANEYSIAWGCATATTSSTSSPRLGAATEEAGTAQAPPV
jgi:hypothetical protein